jgi:peptidase E
MVNLIAIWAAHGVEALLRECLEEGILVCGQSAGAMCWFEQGVTRSAGPPAAAAGFGLLEGSACVHYRAEPVRREFFLRSVAAGEMSPGLGLEDQTAALYEDGRLVETFSARDGAAVWRVGPDGEERLLSRRIVAEEPPTDALGADILELRETLAARAATRRSRRTGVGRLD